jgi:hypothetical protein
MNTVTYDHRLRRIGHPVRSAIHKPQIGRLVVKWVTISEYLLLYVSSSFFLLSVLLFFAVLSEDYDLVVCMYAGIRRQN